MKDIWFSDSRDIVKWAVVAHLAEGSPSALAVQLAFYRPARPSDYKLRHVSGDGSESLEVFPQKVTSAFERRVQQIKDKSLGIDVELYAEPFAYVAGDGEYRNKYVAKFIDWLRVRRGNRRVVLLADPDTGLEGESTCGPAYVKARELRTLFASLLTGDWLVLYQHAPRKKEWIADGRERVATALGLSALGVHVFDCVDVAEDVAFFAARRDSNV